VKLFFSFLMLASLCLNAFAHSAEFPSNNQELTLSIIKPDAVAKNNIGEIITRFEKANLQIAAIKMVSLSKEKVEEFYAVHKERPFFADLTNFVSSGPIVAMVLKGDNAIAKNREIMGATDFKKAVPGTIRADFAESVTKNAVHGSDSPENAKAEISFFFQPSEIVR
jgi:nucleoside-diphosphate kinase